ncbi:unnamed protein product [Arctia plantaginis]|uniref:Uncharacterized protein n=1 Tax=Arctia plantaginis TaxID=874455 RepID=A0A8S0ZD83_ARCPL|nr:unnamed protein product [Arctia plantaginis]
MLRVRYLITSNHKQIVLKPSYPLDQYCKFTDSIAELYTAYKCYNIHSNLLKVFSVTSILLLKLNAALLVFENRSCHLSVQ